MADREKRVDEEGCVLKVLQEALVSVIMPAYNADKYITESALSVLRQSYTNLELIIVNDASQDATGEIIARLRETDKRVQAFNKEINCGCAAARNFALAKARGEYIAFCDSDDLWEKEKLAKQLSCFHKYNADMVFTAYEMTDAAGKRIKNRNVKSKITLEDLLKENSIIFSTTLFKRNALAGMQFDTGFFHEDYVFLLDCLRKNLKFVGLDENLVKYRVHNDGRSFNKINAAKYRWKIYREYLGFNMAKAIYYFAQYSVRGLKKYL